MDRLGSIIVLCAALALSGGLRAEESPARAVPRSEPATGTLQRARERVAGLTLRADRVHVWLREARGKRLAARSRCLDGLLSQAHAIERQGQSELDTIERLADEGAGEALKSHWQRLDNIVKRSQQIVVAANQCGKVISRRVRAPTQYRVRLMATR